ARSRVGAIGYAQVMVATAQWYQPGITEERLYDRETNLKLGFRYLRDLLRRHKGDMRLALLSYNRGPARVQELLNAGRNPNNGYERSVMSGYRRGAGRT
ncbi:MAG: transglycosylase SLT domain-containing protein, partial [Gemmatimonadales bacterium]